MSEPVTPQSIRILRLPPTATALFPEGSRRFQPALEEPRGAGSVLDPFESSLFRAAPRLTPHEGTPMRPYRDIATVSALQVVRFPGRAHFEPQFFLLHLPNHCLCGALDPALLQGRWPGLYGWHADADRLVGHGVCQWPARRLQRVRFTISSAGGGDQRRQRHGWRFRSPFRPDDCFLRAPWKRESAGPGKTATTFATCVGASRSTTESWRSGFRT